MDDIATVFEDLYVSYRKSYVVMEPGKEPRILKHKDGSPYTLTSKTVQSHLAHKYAICVFAGKSASKFICFDVDDGDRGTVRKIQKGLTKIGFPEDSIYVSSSGGKGYHVEMFFDGLVYTSQLRKVYAAVCAAQKLDTKKVEFRPTATQSIKLPLSVHRKTGNVCWYLDAQTLSPIPDQSYILSIKKIPVSTVEAIAARLPDFEKPKPVQVATALTSTVAAAAEFPQMTERGTRHNMMLDIARKCRNIGLTADECVAQLTSWYNKQDKDLIATDEVGVLKDINLISQWVYGDTFQYRILKRDTTKFTAYEAQEILSQNSPVKRKLMFLAIRAHKYYGVLQVPQETLAGLFHVTVNAIYNAVKQLEASDYITVRHQKARRAEDGNIYVNANKIYPNDMAACDVKAEDLDAESMPVMGADTDWYTEYCTLISCFVKPEHLSKFLRPREVLEINNFLGGTYYERRAS